MARRSREALAWKVPPVREPVTATDSHVSVAGTAGRATPRGRLSPRARRARSRIASNRASADPRGDPTSADRELACGPAPREGVAVAADDYVGRPGERRETDPSDPRHQHRHAAFVEGRGSRASSLAECPGAVSYTHLRAHETGRNLVCRLLLDK